MKRPLSTHLLAAVAFVAFSAGAQAQPSDGRTMARACAACHGPLGVAVTPDAPHLAGQPELYLITQLKAYRSGKRQHEAMSIIARSLSDADIRGVAEWFASMQIDAKEKR